jgi:hypothetical protein
MDLTNKTEYFEKIEKLKNDFYTDNTKNMFFKKKQKMECANSISKQIDLTLLLNYTICIIPNTNKIHIDYTIFKSYAHPDIFININNKLIEVLDICKQQYGGYEIYVNIESLTVSALERYKELMLYFSKLCNDSQLNYTDYLKRCVIYNSPHFIDNMKTIIYPLLTKKTIEIIEFYNKKDSDIIKKHIFETL